MSIGLSGLFGTIQAEVMPVSWIVHEGLEGHLLAEKERKPRSIMLTLLSSHYSNCSKKKGKEVSAFVKRCIESSEKIK